MHYWTHVKKLRIYKVLTFQLFLSIGGHDLVQAQPHYTEVAYRLLIEYLQTNQLQGMDWVLVSDSSTHHTG